MLIVQDGNKGKELLSLEQHAGNRAVPLQAGRYLPQNVSVFLRSTGCRATARRAVHKFQVEHTLAEATIDAGVLRQTPLPKASAITKPGMRCNVMYRTEDEKWADTKLGEAVLFLLREGAPVNEAMLLLRLQQMLMTENDAASRKATFSTIRQAEAASSMRKQKTPPTAFRTERMPQCGLARC